MAPVSLIIVGAGDRGMNAYAPYSLAFPEKATIVAVAEPNEILRERAAEKYSIPADRCYQDWREVAAQPKFADAVLVCTQDRHHAEPAIAFMKKGYHVQLEKPMAVTETDCRAIAETAKQTGVILAVCHVLRYTRYTKLLKKLLQTGAVGEIVTVRHLEPVGWWHQAHSFVRGNWRNTEQSTCMLMAKSCHDLDYLRYIVDRPCRRVSSFGSLKHFNKENQPAGASDRCTTCPNEIESQCPYSALTIYLSRDPHYWPVSVLTTDHTPEGVMRALEEGPYGRCVYACDNDVVDHQTVNLEFEGGATAVFTMTAFNKARGRESYIMGTHGEVRGDGRRIWHCDFRTGEEKEYDADSENDGGILSGHGGGDYGMAEAFISAVAHNDPTRITSGADISLESHLMVFAAERARLNGSVEQVKL